MDPQQINNLKNQVKALKNRNQRLSDQISFTEAGHTTKIKKEIGKHICRAIKKVHQTHPDCPIEKLSGSVAKRALTDIMESLRKYEKLEITIKGWEIMTLALVGNMLMYYFT